MHTETFLLKVTFCFCYLYIHIFILYPDCDTVHAHGTVHSQLSLYLSYSPSHSASGDFANPYSFGDPFKSVQKSKSFLVS